MAFDQDKFMATGFVAREDTVPVPDLKGFFNKTEKPLWKVRGLKGVEIGRAREASDKNKTIKAVVEGLLENNSKKKAEAVLEIIGNPKNVPQDIAYRIEIFKAGSVDPALDYPVIVRLCEAFPIEFYLITNKIIELSGKGHIPGKAPPSGKTTKSKAH